jgi:hypothetical protein
MGLTLAMLGQPAKPPGAVSASALIDGEICEKTAYKS